MNNDISYKNIKKLEELLREVNGMTIPETYKSDMLDFIDQNINLLRYDLIKSLGEEAYDKMEERYKK